LVLFMAADGGKGGQQHSQPSVSAYKQSSLQAYVHFVKGNLGPGCLSLPYAFSLVGPVWGPVAMVLMGAMTVYNMCSLVKAKQKVQHLGIATFSHVGLYAFGKAGQFLVDTFLVTMQLSVCTVYFSFISANLARAAPVAWHLSQRTIILLALPALAGCSLIRHMRDLTPFSLAANVSLLIGMGLLCSIMFAHWRSDPPEHIAQFSATNVPLFLGNAIYAFEGIGTLTSLTPEPI
jgi:solute carrier family 36 (proton-coupled amino acid transporter)